MEMHGAYRNINYDMRMYKRLKMYFHAEPGADGSNLNDGDLSAFAGWSDFDANYYEYEIPLTVTPWYTSVTSLFGLRQTKWTLSQMPKH